MISNATRQRLRLILQNTEIADEILAALDVLTNGTLMINRIISEDVVVAPGMVYLQRNPIQNAGVNIEVQPGGEVIVL